MNRDELLQLSLRELEKLCRISTCRGVGPGGQKRNKTESAVHVLCPLFDVAAFDDTTRSQHQNKDRALAKLRMAIALRIRETSPSPWKGPVPGPSSQLFPCWAAAACDFLEAADYKISLAAEAMGCSSARLGKDLQKSPALWQHLNQQRLARNLPPLKQR